MHSKVAFILGALVLCAPRAAQAQGLDLELSPFGGGAFFLHDGPKAMALEGSSAVPPIVEGARFEDTWAAGATVGLRIHEVFAVEALLTWVPTWLVGTNLTDGTDVYAYMYGVSGVAHLPLPGPLRPFVGVGAGGASYDYSGSIRSHTSWMATVIGGLDYDLGGGRSLRLQARDFVTPFDSALPGAGPGQGEGWQNDLMISAGMSWRVPLGPRSAPRLRTWDFEPRMRTK